MNKKLFSSIIIILVIICAVIYTSRSKDNKNQDTSSNVSVTSSDTSENYTGDYSYEEKTSSETSKNSSTTASVAQNKSPKKSKDSSKTSSVASKSNSKTTSVTSKSNSKTSSFSQNNSSQKSTNTEKYRFRNNSLLSQHYQKHGKDMGFSSASQYEKAAADVITNLNALHKTEAEDGDTVYYVESTNEFVVLSTDGYIRTYFLPDAGKAYYDRQ